MIRQFTNLWVLDTKNTTYAFRLLPTGQLEHLYYGETLFLEREEDAECLKEQHVFQPGNGICYDQEHLEYTLEDMRLEMSSYGKGDIREPFVEILHADGSFTNDFVYESAEIVEEKQGLCTLPSSYGERIQQLYIHLVDKKYQIHLQLRYSVFEDCDVIVRSAVLTNRSNEDIQIKRLMSTQLDLEKDHYIFTTFNGSWANEMRRSDHVVAAGKVVNQSFAGTSSSRANPFVMLAEQGCTEDSGNCYGFNLIYSGNHYEACEVNGYHKTRVVMGINPQQFTYRLSPEEYFESPEAVMTFSRGGYQEMSHHMHEFVRNHVIRGEWKYKQRPILLNSWEAAYFNINESKLLKLAKAGKDVGIELFVMDDGWFGNRKDDSCSLGDWEENREKLPNGLSGIANKVNELGMEFGIWVEPEMVNVNSRLFRQHNDWTLEIPGNHHSEGRNQRILDLCNPEVCTYIIDTMKKVFSSANISYVKWDMNRIFSDYYSPYLAKCGHDHVQGEVNHRYMMGLYHIMQELTTAFPHILFEGCSAGGNRFDLGILCYFPQIWASDNTDAITRSRMQTNYSYGYPLSVMGAHVSACPNHQTLRNVPLATRFNVAAFGVCGYECNLSDMKKEELEEIKKQIEIYKKYRQTLQFGDFYRVENGNIHQWCCVSKDKREAVGMLLQELVEPNTQFHQFFAKGLAPQKRYHFTNIKREHNIKGFGDLVNTVSPVHIKQDSLVHNVLAKFVTMPGEEEDYVTTGQILMSGVKLKQAFSATGYNDKTRHFPDFSSRMYFMEEI